MKKILVLSLAFAALAGNTMIAMNNEQNVEDNKPVIDTDTLALEEAVCDLFNEEGSAPVLEEILIDLKDAVNDTEESTATAIQELIIALEQDNDQAMASFFEKVEGNHAQKSKLASVMSFVGNNKFKVLLGLIGLGVAGKYAFFNKYDLGVQKKLGDVLRTLPMPAQSLIEQGMRKMGSDFTTHAESVNNLMHANYENYKLSMAHNVTEPCVTFRKFVTQNPMETRPLTVQMYDVAQNKYTNFVNASPEQRSAMLGNKIVQVKLSAYDLYNRAYNAAVGKMTDLKNYCNGEAKHLFTIGK